MTESLDYVVVEEYIMLGIPVIDKQHANLVRIAHNLHLVCQSDSEITNYRFINAVQEAVDYIRGHCKTEERLMELSGFPGYLAHKKEHGDFIWEIISWSRQFQDGQKSGPRKFARFLTEWIKFHIGISDKAFADFFLNMNQHGKIRQALVCDPQLSGQTA